MGEREKDLGEAMGKEKERREGRRGEKEGARRSSEFILP